MIFYLGAASVHWLNFSPVPLFVSVVRLRLVGTKTENYYNDTRLRKREIAKWPRAVCRWAMDSGGFSELSVAKTKAEIGRVRYRHTPLQYCREVDRAIDEIGNLDWAAIQDWMVEPIVLTNTGLTIEEHQRRTVQSYLDLKTLRPNHPWAPVLQGFTLSDYIRCFDMYYEAGVNLIEDTSIPVVGIGSVCRREGTKEAEEIIAYFYKLGLRIHAFGFKIEGVANVRNMIQSADSLAWSHGARHREPMPGHDIPHDGFPGHKHCNNCFEYAIRWRQHVLGYVDESEVQMALKSEKEYVDRNKEETGEQIAYRLLFGENK